MSAIDLASKIIKLDEESNKFKERPYYCSEKYPTIGWGFKCGEKNAPLPLITMAKEAGDKKLESLIVAHDKNLREHINTRHIYPSLNDARQAVIISMAYQLGFAGLLKFRKMWVAIERQDYVDAANQIMDSLAARQTPNRYKRNAEMMRTGKILQYYG
jgi:lysozyme